MMRIKFCYGLLLLFLVVACTTKYKPKEGQLRERDFDKSVNLLVSDSMKIAETFDLQAWTIGANSVAFVTYGQTEGFVSVYSYPACQKLYDSGRIGQGPGEFITLNAGYAEKGTLLLYDIMGRKLERMVVGSDSLHILQTLPLYNSEDGLCKPFTCINYMGGNNYLMKVDEMHTSYWEIADLENGKVLSSYLNPIRKAEASYTPFHFVPCVYDSVFLAAYSYIDRVELYSISNNEITPRFVFGTSEDQSELKTYNDLLYYYISVVSQSGLFYCLKSSDGTKKGDIVEVYDIEGRCREKYVLEKAVVSLNIDTEGYLVGYVPEEDATILYRFAL